LELVELGSGLEFGLCIIMPCLMPLYIIYFLLFQKKKKKKIGIELAAVQKGCACPNPAAHI
jgi:hypothetical protein